MSASRDEGTALRQRALELALQAEQTLHEALPEERLSIVQRAAMYYAFMKDGKVPKNQEVEPAQEEIQE